MHTKNDKKWRFFTDHILQGEKKSSEIGTLVSMMMVTLNFYITSSLIQMSSQRKFLKYFENLSKSFNQTWKHPSKCGLRCQSRRWGQKDDCHCQTNREQTEISWGKTWMSLSIVFLNTPCNASTNTILIIPWPTVLPKFYLSLSKFYPLSIFLAKG